MRQQVLLSSGSLKINGFSLIELLVVLLIVGMAIGMVTMNVGNSSADLRLEAKNFANLTAVVAQEAALTGEQLAVDIYRDTTEGNEHFAYRWLQRVYWAPPEESDEKPRWLWLPIDINEIDSEVSFSSQLLLRLEIEGIDVFLENKVEVEKKPEQQKTPVKPDILLQANGEISAFKLMLFTKDDNEARHTVSGDLLGRIELDKPSEER